VPHNVDFSLQQRRVEDQPRNLRDGRKIHRVPMIGPVRQVAVSTVNITEASGLEYD
jgi:hypothetical protein